MWSRLKPSEPIWSNFNTFPACSVNRTWNYQKLIINRPRPTRWVEGRKHCNFFCLAMFRWRATHLISFRVFSLSLALHHIRLYQISLWHVRKKRISMITKNFFPVFALCEHILTDKPSGEPFNSNLMADRSSYSSATRFNATEGLGTWAEKNAGELTAWD